MLLPNIKLTVAATGAAAVLIVLILCITALLLYDRVVPGVLYFIAGALVTPLALAATKSE
jgi:hypothetical protein